MHLAMSCGPRSLIVVCAQLGQVDLGVLAGMWQKCSRDDGRGNPSQFLPRLKGPSQDKERMEVCSMMGMAASVRPSGDIPEYLRCRDTPESTHGLLSTCNTV